jgi:hypothetical protein
MVETMAQKRDGVDERMEVNKKGEHAPRANEYHRVLQRVYMCAKWQLF